MDTLDYYKLRVEQAEKRKKGELMGIGISTFYRNCGHRSFKDFDILGIKMFDSAEIRVHPTGKSHRPIWGPNHKARVTKQIMHKSLPKFWDYRLLIFKSKRGIQIQHRTD